MVNYWAGDFLIRIKNAGMAGRSEVSMPSTKLIYEIAKCLKKEGYLAQVNLENGILKASLAIEHKKAVISDIKLVSKPGLRVYRGVDELKVRKQRASMLILSTPKGIISQAQAIKENVGGEVIAEIS